MNQLEKNAFNYNKLNPEIVNFLKQREDNMRKTVSDAYYQIGKELKKAQDKLSQHGYGCFQEWSDSLGFSKRTVYNYMNYHDLIVQNLHNQKQIESLPRSLVYEIAKPSGDPEVKKQVLAGEIKTHKEYQRLKKENEQIKQDLFQEKERKKVAYQKIKDLENKDSEVIEKEIFKEVVPDELQEELNGLRKKVKKLDDEKDEIKNYKQEKKKLHDEISELLEYKRKVREENDLLAREAEIVQGICGPIRKLRNKKGDIESLMKKNVSIKKLGVNTIIHNAEFLEELAQDLFNYAATQKSQQEGGVINA